MKAALNEMETLLSTVTDNMFVLSGMGYYRSRESEGEYKRVKLLSAHVVLVKC